MPANNLTTEQREWPELRDWRPPRLGADLTAARLRVGTIGFRYFGHPKPSASPALGNS
jgi:hypothetical protein